MSKTKKKKLFLELLLLALILLLAIFLWDTIIIYPVKLMIVLLHEISHGLAAILTGGKVIDLDINLDLSGFSKIEGGNKFIIASSGYLGSLIFGMILFYSGYQNKFRNIVLPIIASLIIIFLINSSSNQNLILISIGIIFLLFLLNNFLPIPISTLIYKALGLISCFYVLIDIKQDILDSDSTISDAAVIAEITGTIPTIWGMLWLIISIIAIFLLIKLSYTKSLRS